MACILDPAQVLHLVADIGTVSTRPDVVRPALGRQRHQQPDGENGEHDQGRDVKPVPRHQIEARRLRCLFRCPFDLVRTLHGDHGCQCAPDEAAEAANARPDDFDGCSSRDPNQRLSGDGDHSVPRLESTVPCVLPRAA